MTKKHTERRNNIILDNKTTLYSMTKQDYTRHQNNIILHNKIMLYSTTKQCYTP